MNDQSVDEACSVCGRVKARALMLYGWTDPEHAVGPACCAMCLRVAIEGSGTGTHKPMSSLDLEREEGWHCRMYDRGRRV